MKLQHYKIKPEKNMEKISQELEYITSDKVGKVIYEGLSALYEKKPDHPVSYLANWLLNYCATETHKNEFKEGEAKKQQLIEKLNQAREEEIKEKQKQEEVQAAKDFAEAAFSKKVEEHLYLEEMLGEEFPEFLRQTLELPAVYIGQNGYALKQISDDEEDPNAHLEMTQEKVIRYIGASKDQKFVIGKYLPADSGVTYDVLRPQDEQNQQPDEEGLDEEESSAPKPKYLYVPDVTQESRMSFLRIPKLGAWIGCSLAYNSVLSELAFDEGLKERVKVQQEKAEQQKEIEAKEAEFRQRIEDAEDAGQNVAEIEEEWNNIVWPEIKEKDFEIERKEFVLCADTLGEDRGISEAHRKYLEESANFFVKCWEQSEKNQLSNDIDRQLEYIKNLNKEEFLKNFNDKFEDDVNEKIKNYEREQEEEQQQQEPTELQVNYVQAYFRAEFLRESLADEEVKGFITALKEYRVVKFLGIIQNALILAGYLKEQINVPGTNILDWKKAKNYINELDFFRKLALYQIKGPKEFKSKEYAKPQRILRRLEGINLEEVDDYNVGLGILYRFVKQVLEARILDVEVRKAEKVAQRAKRDQLIQDAENLKAAREQALEQAQASVPEEEEFNLEQWEAEWEENNPEIEIPEEVVDDIDEDMEILVETN